MRASRPAKSFTGRHMAAILIAGFGVVVAVNFFMASLATGGFHGVVVENSYVASQKFNDWLEEAKEAEALGWEAAPTRNEAGYAEISTTNVPGNATITAQLRRPIGTRERASLTFMAMGNGRYRSRESIADGRWIARVYIESGGQKWADESELR